MRVLELALAQLPESWRAKSILIRADTAGASQALVDERDGLGLEYSVGFPITEPFGRNRSYLGPRLDIAGSRTCW